jgi:hypothetical protein
VGAAQVRFIGTAECLLATLRAWVTDYYHRVDEWSYQAHRRIFDAHADAKIEHMTVVDRS